MKRSHELLKRDDAQQHSHMVQIKKIDIHNKTLDLFTLCWRRCFLIFQMRESFCSEQGWRSDKLKPNICYFPTEDSRCFAKLFYCGSCSHVTQSGSTENADVPCLSILSPSGELRSPTHAPQQCGKLSPVSGTSLLIRVCNDS